MRRVWDEKDGMDLESFSATDSLEVTLHPPALLFHYPRHRAHASAQHIIPSPCCSEPVISPPSFVNPAANASLSHHRTPPTTCSQSRSPSILADSLAATCPTRVTLVVNRQVLLCSHPKAFFQPSHFNPRHRQAAPMHPARIPSRCPSSGATSTDV